MFGKAGRAETATDPAPLEMFETIINLRPKAEWRTGRTLMANLEVLDETAERVLGHSQGGLMATYNVSRHRKQKTAALTLLQDEILRIVSKPESNVDRLKVA